MADGDEKPGHVKRQPLAAALHDDALKLTLAEKRNDCGLGEKFNVLLFAQRLDELRLAA